jgi:ankyrin repeat protein
MVSPSASSATLSIHSSQDGESWDENDSISETGSSLDFSPEQQLLMEYRLQSQKDCSNCSNDMEYSRRSSVGSVDNFVVSGPEEYLEEDRQFPLSAIIKAASNADSIVQTAVTTHANNISAARAETNAESSSSNNIRAIPTSWKSAQCFAERGIDSPSTFAQERGISTPLKEAIRAQSLEEVVTLLAAGAHPNGTSHDIIERYSAFFLRFRPKLPESTKDVASRDDFTSCMGLGQLAPLTIEEVEDRYFQGIAPFWCEEGFTERQLYPNGGFLSSLIEAARFGSIDIFEQLMEAGADYSFWVGRSHPEPSSRFISSLCISTPLHAAIETRNSAVVRHLLDLGFDPNALPTANPTRCVTPLMATITACNPFSIEAFDILINHPRTNPCIRTPVYRAHILHFAVARLDLKMLQHVVSIIPLHQAGTTALGHRLLHIACMPANSLHIQRHSAAIFRSIHDTRNLDCKNDPFVDITPGFVPPSLPEVFYTKHFKAQTAIIQYLWNNGLQGIDEQDIYGNTPLHYLAGHHYMNLQLLNWWLVDLKSKEVETAWKTCQNFVGATPEKLCLAAETVKKFDMTGHKPWFWRWERKARVERKERIWEELLDERRKLTGDGRG